MTSGYSRTALSVWSRRSWSERKSIPSFPLDHLGVNLCAGGPTLRQQQAVHLLVNVAVYGGEILLRQPKCLRLPHIHHIQPHPHPRPMRLGRPAGQSPWS